MSRLKSGIERAGAVVGQAGVLFEKQVDVGGVPVACAAAHHQHVVNDAIRAVAVGPDPFQVCHQVLRYLLDQVILVVAFLFQHLLKLH